MRSFALFSSPFFTTFSSSSFSSLALKAGIKQKEIKTDLTFDKTSSLQVKDIPYKIFIIAGEASGDFLGAHLMHALKNLIPSLRFRGIGGPLMVEEGLDLFMPAEKLSYMGLFEIIPHLKEIYKNFKGAQKEIEIFHPDLLITIDSPGFNFKLLKKLKKHSFPKVHYVAPTVWAWREKRAQKIAPLLTHLLALFPFEPPYFEKEGLTCTFVGHPIIEEDFKSGKRERFYQKYGIMPKTPLLCLLPGSRKSELKNLLPIFKETVGLLKKEMPFLEVVLPTLPHLTKELQIYLEDWPLKPLLITDKQDKLDAYQASTVALAASGTIALELAAADLPMVIAYKVSPFTAYLLRFLLKTPYVSLINILLKEKVVPELLQENCKPDILFKALLTLFESLQKRNLQQAAFQKALTLLRPTSLLPSQRAAEVIATLLNQGS